MFRGKYQSLKPAFFKTITRIAREKSAQIAIYYIQKAYLKIRATTSHVKIARGWWKKIRIESIIARTKTSLTEDGIKWNNQDLK